LNIYIFKDDQQFGPYSPKEILKRISNRELTENDYGWHEGCDEWIELRNIKAVFPDANEPVLQTIQKWGLGKTLVGLITCVFLIAKDGKAIGLFLEKFAPGIGGVGKIVEAFEKTSEQKQEKLGLPPEDEIEPEGWSRKAAPTQFDRLK